MAVLFVVDPVLWAGAGPVRQAWLAASLRTLDADLDGRLVLRHGDPRDVVPHVAQEVGAAAVHVTRETTPVGARRDVRVAQALEALGIGWVETGTPYAVGPGLVRTGGGTAYQVFTPFYRAWRAHGWPDPAPAPQTLATLDLPGDPAATSALDAALAADDLPTLPEPGEAAARQRWADFRESALATYTRDRNIPALDGSSRLSPYLKVGAIHPRTLLADLAHDGSSGAATFSKELAWREFYADVLHHDPASSWQDLRAGLADLRYDEPEDAVEAWKDGTTGYPIVDAGMRQLRATGWMHNRVRMLTASFLTKDLHVRWQVGARWFLDRLVDGDLASNNHGWQWVAGTGTDAAPYFRVFNPILQGEKFDPQGDYVRRWVPELAHLPGKAVHQPWQHDEGYAHGYPHRLVDHDEERRETLARYEATRA